MIEYAEALDGVRPDDLDGFFVGWPAHPTPERHLALPLLEVLPEYQGQGVGTELVRRLLARLDSLYMVDLCCDAERGLGLRRPEAPA
jgi:ribosomal protein S18 acetylase RimI-like enzyme